MRKTFIALIAALAICIPSNPIDAAPKSPKLSKCKGKERRPANPYGTILPTINPSAGTSTPAETADDQERARERKRDSVNVFPGPVSTAPEKPAGKTVRQVPPIGGASPSNFYRSR